MDWFDTRDVSAVLKKKSARGGVVTIGCQAGKFFLTIASTFILARLLTPEDYGLVAMVGSFIIFASLFKDIGLSVATVQYEKINHEQISSLFWINVAISVGLALVLCAISPVIAYFYSEDRLVLVTMVSSVSFIFSGLTIQHQALLRRKMMFPTLAGIETISMFTGIFISLIIGYLTRSYWALVASELICGCLTCLLVWHFVDWRPGRMKITQEVRKMLKFGWELTGFNVVNYFARNADNVLIGYFNGAGALGLYNKAYNLLLLPITQINGPISSVAIPLLSRLQNDPKKYAEAYYRALNVIAYLTMPLMGLLIVMADEVILILLGEQWKEVAVIFRVLALTGLIQPLGNTVGWVYTSLGQTDRFFRFGMISSPIMVLSFVVGIQWGAIGVAACYAVVVYLLAWPMFWYAFRLSPIRCSKVAVVVARPITLTLLLVCVVGALRILLPQTSPLLDLLKYLTMGVVTFGVAFACWPAMRAELLSAWSLARDGFRSK